MCICFWDLLPSWRLEVLLVMLILYVLHVYSCKAGYKIIQRQTVKEN